jgi:hypothetical protein
MTKAWLWGFALAVLLSTSGVLIVRASDHDDGEFDEKGRAYALTDLYAFREDWHDSTGDSGNLILVMNTSPRSLPKQQYFFSTKARYEFHIKRVTDRTVAYSSGEDVLMRLGFTAPDADDKQTPYPQSEQPGFYLWLRRAIFSVLIRLRWLAKHKVKVTS